jgi:hypothetical protein
MKKGKQLGAYNSKVLSISVRDKGKIEINVEGNIEGIGQGFATVTVTVGNKNGEYGYNGVAYTPSGETLTAAGEGGKYESIGANRWATTGLLKAADGRTMLEEGIFDMAAKTWNGKYYEAI